MDIVSISLTRRRGASDDAAAEIGEAVDVLWAHTAPEDHLEHAGGRATADRLDLLLFFLPSGSTDPVSRAEQRAAALLHRAHHASPLLQHRYLPPPEPAARPRQNHPTA